MIFQIRPGCCFGSDELEKNFGVVEKRACALNGLRKLPLWWDPYLGYNINGVGLSLNPKQTGSNGQQIVQISLWTWQMPWWHDNNYSKLERKTASQNVQKERWRTGLGFNFHLLTLSETEKKLKCCTNAMTTFKRPTSIGQKWQMTST